MAEGFEYVAVELSAKEIASEDALTSRLNAVAGHGWRLISVLPAGKFSQPQAIFERPVAE